MRRTIALTLLLGLGLTAGPAAGQDEKNFDTPYYPLKVGNRWTYRSGDKQRVVIEVVGKKTLTRVLGIEAAREKKERLTGYVLKISSGDKSQTEVVAVTGQGVCRFEAAEKEISPALPLLQLPLKPGETWPVKSASEGASIRGTFVGGEEAVKVPAGQFRAMTATAKDFQIGGSPVAWQMWFAPGVGMVRQQFQIGGHKSVLELEKFEPAR